jgi:hypothetical protein
MNTTEGIYSQNLQRRLRINHVDQESKNEILELVLNIASVAAMGGYLPTQEDRETPERGVFWQKAVEPVTGSRTKYDLAPRTNNFWAFVEEKDPLHTDIFFHARYGKLNWFEDAIGTILVNKFPNIEFVWEPIP